MKEQILFLVLEIAAILIGYAMGRYCPQEVKDYIYDEMEVLTIWAEKFVRWARQFMDGATGAQKMAAVVGKLKDIANKFDIEITEDELKAITQSAYDAMKAAEDEYRPQNTTFVINTGTTAVATDDVPEGALEPDEDGNIKVYDKDGNQTGTITPEEAAEAAERVTQVQVE